jgi:thiamine biosynthesis protein ThiS
VKSLGLDPALVVAEVNGEIVKRQFYASRTLADRDSVEIVRLVGGG